MLARGSASNRSDRPRFGAGSTLGRLVAVNPPWDCWCPLYDFLFFFDLAARCFFAAFMLSTRLGYLRPAFFAAALALALLLGVNLV